MWHKKGFSLFSFLLYLTLFSMITLFSCHIIVSLIVPSLFSIRRSQSIIAMHIATDLLVKDIYQGVILWKETKSTELMWQNKDHDISWRIDHGRVERKENGTTSIVATGVDQGFFSITKRENDIMGIELTLIPTVDKKKVIVSYVAVPKEKNG
jgi:type II secretory pathway component PulJ